MICDAGVRAWGHDLVCPWSHRPLHKAHRQTHRQPDSKTQIENGPNMSADQAMATWTLASFAFAF